MGRRSRLPHQRNYLRLAFSKSAARTGTSMQFLPMVSDRAEDVGTCKDGAAGTSGEACRFAEREKYGIRIEKIPGHESPARKPSKSTGSSHPGSS